MERARTSRKAFYTKVRSSLAADLRPVTSRWETFRERVRANRKWSYPLLAIFAITIACILPFLTDWFEIPLWLQRATSGSALAKTALFVLFALGLNVVVGFAGLLDLGYVAFWAIGAYTAGIVSGAHSYTQGGNVGPEPAWAMWMWAILLIALVVSSLAGLLLGSPTLRLRGDYLAIVTLGFGEIIRITANNLDTITGGPRGIRNIPHPALEVGPLDIQWGTLVDVKYYWLLLTLVVLWIIAIRMLDNSRIGRAWVAIREDEVAAAAMGVRVIRMKLAAFAIGACTAGVGGVIYAEQVNFISPTSFTIQQSILILAMVVIGGMGSIPGAIFGASAVVLLPEVFRQFGDYRYFAFGVAIVLVMVFRPQGILPSKRRKAELLGGTHDEQLYEAGSSA
jgi:branched-chain amino acid transport system permease protein